MLWSVHEQLKLSAPITIAWRVSVTFIFHVLLFAKTVITALGSDEQSTVTSFPFRNFGVAILCVGDGIGLPDGESSPSEWAFASCPAVTRTSSQPFCCSLDCKSRALNACASIRLLPAREAIAGVELPWSIVSRAIPSSIF